MFYGKDWLCYGTRGSTAEELARVTRTDTEILRADRAKVDRVLPTYSIAARMS